MKWLPLLLAGFATFTVDGCYSINTIENSSKAGRPNVVPDKRVVWDATLQGKLTAGNVIETLVSGNLKHIQVDVTNNYAYALEFVYQVEWFDAAGMKLELPAGGWKRLHLEAHESSTFAATASSPRALDFNIKLQEAKGNNTIF